MVGEKERIDPRVWKIACVAVLGPLMTTLDTTVVNVSLATLGHELRTPISTIQWVISGYLLALALTLPLSDWLVNRMGAKRLYICCFGLFTITSLLCGLATSAESLIAFRVLQGMAGGLLAPLAQMMIARIAGSQMARVMGFMVIPVLIGPVLGLVLAGVILEHASWRWIFFINLPIGIVSTVCAIRILPEDTHESRSRIFDLTGFLLLSPGLVLLLHSLEKLSSDHASRRLTSLELLLAISLLGAFGLHAIRNSRTAIIDITLFRRPIFLTGACVQFLSNAVSYGGQMLVPLYLLLVAGMSASKASLLLGPVGLGMLCSYPAMGFLSERLGPRTISSAGAFIALIGTLPFSLCSAHSLTMTVLCAALFVRGAGMGAINIPSIAAVYGSVPKEMIPAATTAINIIQRLGGPVATTLLAVFLHAHMRISSSQTAHAFTVTFWLLCGIHALSVVAALRLPIKSMKRERNNPSDSIAANSAFAE
jgi:EmrB/QacA subfamily drug resistance transporter